MVSPGLFILRAFVKGVGRATPPIFAMASYYRYRTAQTNLELRPPPTQRWQEIESDLQTGDLVLLMGTGNVSKQITAASFVWWLWRPEALEYSHVGVIIRRGSQVYMLEAIDNLDVKAKDVEGQTRYKQVQLVDPKKRIFGTTEYERKCYCRCGVRRLEGSSIPSSLAETYVRKNVGRSMDTDKLMVLAFVHPSLYHRQGDKVTCSELVADLYKEAGLIREDHAQASISYSPMTLAFDTPRELGLNEGVRLGKVLEIATS